uniref:FBA_2 domain-containing protein n=1 Tax=Caenorhabditis tropicalis TaxID=1561998 RepID=A0A1I7TS87_9PELO
MELIDLFELSQCSPRTFSQIRAVKRNIRSVIVFKCEEYHHVAVYTDIQKVADMAFSLLPTSLNGPVVRYLRINNRFIGIRITSPTPDECNLFIHHWLDGGNENLRMLRIFDCQSYANQWDIILKDIEYTKWNFI